MKTPVVNTEVEVILSRSISSDSSNPWLLTIRDRRSGMEVVEVRMDNDTFADMMSGTMAGHLGQAEITVSPWFGKRAMHQSRVVDAAWKRGPDLDRAMETEALRFLRTDPELSRKDPGWIYTGYRGGGGGASTRTLVFVRFLDQDPNKEV